MVNALSIPLSPALNSDAIIQRLVMLSKDRNSSINYGGSKYLYIVPEDTPHVPVGLIDQADVAMHAMLTAGVPIPPEAKANPKNTDLTLCIYQPQTDTYWELWLFDRNTTTGALSCRNAGCTTQASKSPGFFNPNDWTDGNLKSNFGWGHRATSILISHSVITRQSLDYSIENSIALPCCLPLMAPNMKAGKFSYPAQRCDGDNHSDDALWEGARIMLDSTVDARTYTNPAQRALVLTAQTRGMVAVDQSPALGFDSLEVFDLTVPAGTVDATPKWSAMLGADTHPLIEHFPWNRCYVVHADLRTKAGW